MILRNNLIVSLRNARKHLGYTFLNVAGLTIGLTASILILLFVLHERSYDRFHANADRICRVAVRARLGNTRIDQTFTPAILTPTLLEEFPEVVRSVRFRNNSRGILVKVDDRTYNEQRVTAVDAAVFQVFSFPFIHGDPKTALAEPNTTVLTVSTARKYFGDAHPVGQTLTIGDVDFRVTGIIEDIPDNAHFHFDIFNSIITFNTINSTHWFDNNYKTYIQLQEDCTVADFEAKLPEFVKTHLWEGQDYAAWVDQGNFWEYYLQPLTDIHLNSDLRGEFEPNGNAAYVSVLTVIAVFILLIAVMNYMNLATARSAGRAREVGIRKVVGSLRRPLIGQFLAESVMSSLFALALALINVEILLPSFRNLVSRPGIRIPYLEQPLILAGLVGFGLVIGIISGSYPAFFLSSFQPISVLAGKLRSASRNIRLRNGLVLIQFSISIFLFVGTFIIRGQMAFIHNRNLGFDKEHVVVIRTPQPLGAQSIPFKQALLGHPDILSVSGSTTLPGMGLNNIGFRAEGEEKGITLNLIMGDFDLLETLQFKMQEGRFFSRAFPTDSSAIVINEATAKLLGWDNPIGKHLDPYGTELTVIGVVKDFHYESLQNTLEPGAILLLPGVFNWSERYISVRIRPENPAETLGQIRSTWDAMSNGMPFEYTFFDQEYDALYKNEERTGRVFTIFSLLAIFVSCLGLFGLASFAAEQRTREIGIRKVFGASVPGIVARLARDFTRWVVIANVIAWPAAYYAMSYWLHNFAYRMQISITPFVAAGLLTFVIALLTVCYQSVRAAAANPVESLKYE